MKNYLSKYAYFKSTKEMDEAARQHQLHHYDALSKTDRAVLKVIRCHAVKHGAAHLKYETIEKAIGKSNSTVRTTIRKLVKLEIIQKTHFIRPKSAGFGANIYAILPFHHQSLSDTRPIAEKPCAPSVQEDISETEANLSKAKLLKDFKNMSPADISVSLFTKMKTLLSSTIGSHQTARSFYGIHQSISRKMLRFEIYQDEKQTFEDIAYRALSITVFKTKDKTIRNLPGYFKGVYKNLIDEAFFSDSYQWYAASPDQLTMR